MKKYIIVLCFLMAFISLMPGSSVLAEPTDDISIYLNSEKVNLDFPPLIREGRTLVPVRGLFEKMGAAVDWDGTNKQVIINNNEKAIVLTLNECTALVDNEEVKLDVPVKLFWARAYIPLRFIAENMSYDVRWSEKTRTVFISDPVIRVPVQDSTTLKESPAVNRINPGSIVSVALEENPTTGYTWHSSLSDNNVLACESNEFYGADGSKLVGAPGIRLWKFKSIANGSGTITFKYYRDAEGEEAAADTRLYNVDVISGKNDIAIYNQMQIMKSQYNDINIQYPQIAGLANESVQSNINRLLKETALEYMESELVFKRHTINEVGEDFAAAYSGNYEVKLNKNGYLSILFTDHSDTGGAHGISFRKSLTVSLQDGKVYELKDLFTEDSNYIEKINSFVSKQMEKEKDMYTLGNFETIADDQNYYLSEDNLVIYFQLYEYTPYAAGFPEIKIPLSSISDIMNPMFL